MVVCTNCGERNPERARFCLACGSPLPAHPSTGARRVVTVLFCDLVGSTEMVTTLDPESMRSILDRYFEKLAEGGTIEMPLEAAPWGDTFGSLTDRFGTPWLVNITGTGGAAQ